MWARRSSCIPLKHNYQQIYGFLSSECIQIAWGHTKTTDQCNQWTHQQLTSSVHNVETWKWGGMTHWPFKPSRTGEESNIWPTVNEQRIDRFILLQALSSCTLTRNQLQVTHPVLCVQSARWPLRRWVQMGELSLLKHKLFTECRVVLTAKSFTPHTEDNYLTTHK